MEETKKIKRRYITGFDGLRTLAMMGVLFYHLYPMNFKGGYLGVVLFFSLSGYLITDGLNNEWLLNGTFSLKQFYPRRFKKLYPPLLGMIILSTAYMTLFQQNLLVNIRGAIVSSLLYVNNWWQINQNLSYFEQWTNPSPFSHIWFLAVEGQFLIFWPFIYWAIKKWIPQGYKRFRFLVFLTVLSGVLMAFLYHPGADPSRVYYGTDTRLFALMMGCTLAQIWPTRKLRKDVLVFPAKAFLNTIGFISLIGIFISFRFLNDQSTFLYYGGMFLVSLLGTALIGVIAHPDAVLDQFLSTPVYHYIASRCYGLYLYQYPVIVFYSLKVSHIGDHPLLNGLIEVGIIVLLSELSYQIFEKGTNEQHSILFKIKNRRLNQASRKRQVLLVTKLAITLIAIIGFSSATTTKTTATSTQLESQINKNKELAASRKKKAMTTESSSVESTETGESSQDSQSKVDEAKLSPEQQQVKDTFRLSDTQVKKASELEVTAFGDSVILDATADLQQVFPKAIVDADVGRQLYASPEILQKLSSEKMLEDTVIISLGTNGSFTTEQFEECMAILGKRNVYWLNVRVPTRPWQNEVNAMLSEMKTEYKNLTLIDWYSYSEGQTSWFYEDQIHPNEIGLVDYTKLIVDSLFPKNHGN